MKKNDGDFVRDVITMNECALWPESVDILVPAVVRNDSLTLKFPSKALKIDCEIVLAVISNNLLADRFTKKKDYTWKIYESHLLGERGL